MPSWPKKKMLKNTRRMQVKIEVFGGIGMDAKEYLTKVASICKEYDSRDCMNGNCPLIEYCCGAPKEPEKIEAVLKIVKTAELKNRSITEHWA